MAWSLPTRAAERRPKVISGVLARPRLSLALVALVTLTLGAAATRIRFDNTPETWLPTGGAGLEDLAKFRERFADSSLILAFTADAEIEDPDWRRDFGALADELRALSGVDAVEAPRRAVAAAESEAARAELRAGPPGDGPFASPLEPHLIGRDGRHAALALFLTQGLDPRDRGSLVTRIEAVLARAEVRLGPLHSAGADIITHDLDAGTARSLGRLSPLVLVTMCAIFYYATRSARAVGAMLLAAIAAGAWSIGLMALAGRSLNLVIVVMPAILAVLTAAYATHLLSQFLSIAARDEDPNDPSVRIGWWREASLATWRPCVLSAVTDAAGFASLGTSEIQPIRDLGIFTALGVFFALLLTFSLIPALLSLSPRVLPHPVVQRRWTVGRAIALTDLMRRGSAAILVIATVVTVLCGIGLGRLEIESHVLRFFPADHRVPRNYAEVEETLVGLTPFELVLEGRRDQVLSADTLAALDLYLDEARRTEPLLQQILSPVAGETARSLPVAARAARLSTMLQSSEPLPDAARRFVWAADGQLALRVTLTSRTGSSNECHALIERLRANLVGAFPPGIHATITGSATLLIHGQVLLLDTQVKSFALALLVVTLVIAVAFRSVGLVIVSLIPNLMPIALTLGLMGFLEIPLDTATVTVAGIAMGLIVDDTIHMLHRYAEVRQSGVAIVPAVSDTLYNVGRPVLITSLAVATGFAGFALSPFPPTRYFGLLMAFAALTAVVCDLVVLPALLLWRARGSAASTGKMSSTVGMVGSRL